MRRKTTHKNYGKLHEALLVSSSEYFYACSKIADTLCKEYGIFAKAISFEEYNDIPKDIKKLLNTSYHVIFFLSDGIIEKSLAYGDEHQFLKFYAYTHKTNPFAISCVTVNNYSISANNIYPEYMRDFKSLHRIKFTLPTFPNTLGGNIYIKEAVDILAKEIRRYYKAKTKIMLDRLNSIGISGYGSYFYDFKSTAPKMLIINIITLILLFLCAMFDYSEVGLGLFAIPAALTYFVTSIMYIVFAYKKESISIPKSTSFFRNNTPITDHIVRKKQVSVKRRIVIAILAGILLLNGAVYTTIDLEHDILYFVSVPLICSTIKIIADLIEAFVMEKRIWNYDNFLDYSISLAKYRRKANIIKISLFMALSIASLVALRFFL